MDDAQRIVAAGGLVWRRQANGDTQLLIVRRSRYDDWSLPKGKLDPGETLEACAQREVHEETGLRCRLGTRLPTQRYVDHRGRPKEVTYWTMTVLDGAFTPSDEVDEIAWLAPHVAIARLSYDTDRAVVGEGLGVIMNSE